MAEGANSAGLALAPAKTEETELLGLRDIGRPCSVFFPGRIVHRYTPNAHRYQCIYRGLVVGVLGQRRTCFSMFRISTPPEHS